MLCSVWCVYTMFVFHTDIFGYQSLFVCVCVRVQFLPLNSLRLVWPPIDALLGLSFSLIICLIDVNAKKKRQRGKIGREEEKKGMISEKKKKKNISLWLV